MASFIPELHMYMYIWSKNSKGFEKCTKGYSTFQVLHWPLGGTTYSIYLNSAKRALEMELKFKQTENKEAGKNLW